MSKGFVLLLRARARVCVCVGLKTMLKGSVFFCWFQIQLRWTVPKFRFDQTMALGWKKLLPLSLANVFVTAFVILAFG